jgi:putative tryptophan/tyrosine transport system substrate-binding protein
VRRRDFLIGVLLAANTASTQAQQRPKVYRLVVVDPLNPVTDLTGDGELPYYRGFFERLRQSGFAEGGNLEISRYSGEGHFERLGDVVTEAINLKPDAIFLVSTRLLLVFKRATTTIPVIGIMVDPVRYGLAASLARPGGNITGVVHNPGAELYSKRFQLLKEAVPSVAKLGFLISRAFIESIQKRSGVAQIKEAATRAGIELVFPIEALYWREEEYRAAFARMANESVDGIVVSEQSENWTYRRLIIALTKEFRLPAIYPDRMFVELGGLMSFGVNWVGLGRDCARALTEIFNGANPASVPISEPRTHELTVNLATAKAFAIGMPPSLLLRADKMIK